LSSSIATITKRAISIPKINMPIDTHFTSSYSL
jgi:hypothetical protein